MYSDPDIQEIAQGQRGMLKGIDVCIQDQCLVSAVSLIYAAIDGLAALTRPESAEETSGEVFRDWTNRYLLPASGIECTADDLWGARCGILHTYSFDSRTRRRGDAKSLVYGWRGGPEPGSGARLVPEDAIIVHVEDLRAGLESAVVRFLDAIDHDAEVRRRVEKHRCELVCYRPWSPVTIHVAA